MEWIKDNWAILSGCLTFMGIVSWSLIKTHFSVRTLKEWAIAHDISDKEMKAELIKLSEENKDDLVSLIDRNKKATDDAAESIEKKLDTIHDTTTKLSLMNELLLQNKLKTNS